MVRRHISIALLLVLLAAPTAAAPRAHFDKQPPGIVVQDVIAYLSGEAMNSRWHVVTSRKLIGSQMGKEPAYQWYVSFYAPAQDAGKLVYQLPNSSGLLLSRVKKAHGAQLYFPRQTARIVGIGEFGQPGVQQVVLQTRESAADCGVSDVTVFGTNNHMQVGPSVHVGNSCELEARIVKNGDANVIQLSGPYYNGNAALCCPTKPHVTAILAYRNGNWTVKPAYFIISASMAEHH
jgi:hypothetical protein